MNESGTDNTDPWIAEMYGRTDEIDAFIESHLWQHDGKYLIHEKYGFALSLLDDFLNGGHSGRRVQRFQEWRDKKAGESR